ncbi:MAG: hypothetical protein M3M95_08015, partial [Pseudomonadota bacterium]|nr:hypothetical protein [Pseudomonadota bacterium]
MLTDKPYASTPDGLRFDPRFLTAPGAWDEFELPLDLGDPGAPVEDPSLAAPVGEPELASPAGPSDVRTLRNLSTLQAFADGS